MDGVIAYDSEGNEIREGDCACGSLGSVYVSGKEGHLWLCQNCAGESRGKGEFILIGERFLKGVPLILDDSWVMNLRENENFKLKGD